MVDLESVDGGVRVRIDGDTAVIQISFDGGTLVPTRWWEDFYRMKFDDLSHGRVCPTTLGADHKDMCRMSIAVSLATEHRVKQEYAAMIKGAW